MKTRVDVFLVERGIAPSRAQAQDLIAKGRVFYLEGHARKVVSKPSFSVNETIAQSLQIEILADEARYVSRGGLKLKGALERTGLDIEGRSVLDIGISTGGFADCLLQAGASLIVGVDVGHDQLAPRLRADSRVKLLEGVNARDLSAAPILQLNHGQKFGLIVIDVSFISLTLVLPEAIQYLEESSPVLALVKPQFEVGREGLGKNGIVKDPARYKDVEEKIRRTCSQVGLTVGDYFESSIEGTDGNREFFVFAKPAQLALG